MVNLKTRAAFISAALLLALGAMAGPAQAGAPGGAVGLGTAGSFAVLADSAVTNTGPSVITGDVGVHPGTAVTGFPPGTVNGTIHSADAVAQQAQSDLTIAYNDAAGRTPATTEDTELGGETLTPGIYDSETGAFGITGTLTLDAQGDSSSVWIFQTDSTLITASASNVLLINGAQACNVFWKVGSSATLGTGSTFVGNILALTSITATTAATVDGRLLARNGAVTLDTNTITRATCAPPETTECTGTLVGGTYVDIDVPDGATCRLFRVTVAGNVTIGEDSTLIAKAGTDIGGDVTGEDAREVRIIDSDVGGDIDLRRTTGDIVIGSRGCSVDPVVGGTIRLRGNFGPIAVCEMTIGGNLITRNNHASIGLFDNAVAMNIIVEDNRGYGLFVRRNTVAGYILIRDNRHTTWSFVESNRVVGDLRCFRNSPRPVHNDNTVGGARLGQCSGPE